ncbi:MAG: lipoyl(octanoyl) transferase LipB [Candidatus Omnitrophota bacterium]
MAHNGSFPPPVLRWGVDVSYEQASQMQEERVAQEKEALILCEHPPTITLGTSASRNDLVFSPIYYRRMGVTIHKSPRGGKATYHGPGQLVFYPILNLRERSLTVHEHLRLLEEAMIRLCAAYGVAARRIDGKAGAWVGDKKIGFIGVRVRKGFSFHGFSLNIKPQHETFRLITPCGMPDLCVTSLEEETGITHDLWKTGDRVIDIFHNLLRSAESVGWAQSEA